MESSCFFNSASSDGFILYGLWAMGPVPGISSMINSISRSGGIPGKTSGNTLGYSQTIWTWSMVGWAILLLHLNWRGKVSDICSTDIPAVLVMVMAFLAQSIKSFMFGHPIHS